MHIRHTFIIIIDHHHHQYSPTLGIKHFLPSPTISLSRSHFSPRLLVSLFPSRLLYSSSFPPLFKHNNIIIFIIPQLIDVFCSSVINDPPLEMFPSSPLPSLFTSPQYSTSTCAADPPSESSHTSRANAYSRSPAPASTAPSPPRASHRSYPCPPPHHRPALA